MKLSVVVPCLNAAQTLPVQLEALATQQWRDEWEVIVADNGSTDGSRQIVEDFRGRLPRLRSIDASGRKGSGHARNVGASLATGDAFVFCDADDEVSAGWLSAMGEALTVHPFVACRIDLEKLNRGLPASLRTHPQQSGLIRLDYPPYLPHAGGGTLGVWRQVHEAIGGFDLRGLQDTDYCLRAQIRGWELHFTPDAVVRVRRRQTCRGNYRQARLWGEHHVRLYAMYNPRPERRPWQLRGRGLWRWRVFLRQWQDVGRSLRHTRSWGDWAAFSWRLGWHTGLLVGSLKCRVAPPVGLSGSAETSRPAHTGEDREALRSRPPCGAAPP